MTAPNSHSTAFTVTENLMQSSDDSNARPSLAAHRAKVEAEIQDAWERESLYDLCLIARRLLWASHPVPFAGSFGDVVADGATVKDWGAVPELTPPSHTATPDDRVDDGLRGPLDLAPSAIEPLGGKDTALLPGLREALKWKPNTPQLENAMTYAWESAIKSFIRAIENASSDDTTSKQP